MGNQLATTCCTNPNKYQDGGVERKNMTETQEIEVVLKKTILRNSVKGNMYMNQNHLTNERMRKLKENMRDYSISVQSAYSTD